MNELCFNNDIINSLWNIFTSFNGNPETQNYGIRFSMGIFFSMFLLIIIKMRAISTMQKKHIVAMIGALLILIRYTVMMVLEWGYQVGLHDDVMLKFLFPPLEHFFYMMGLGCFAYYSLNNYKYYPGILKKVIWTIPILILLFFIYASITWKNEFIQSNFSIKYMTSDVDYQTHIINSIISLYVTIIAIYKYHKNNHYLSAFWTITFIEHLCRSIIIANHCEPTWLTIIFNALELWSLPLLTLHFIKVYVINIARCSLCDRNIQV